MRRVIFLLVFSSIQIFECNSFDFGSLFGRSSYKVNSPPSVQTLSLSTPKKVFENEEKDENVSFVLLKEEDDLEYNVSISTNDGYVENVTSDNDKQKDLLMANNLTHEALNNSNPHSESSYTQEASTTTVSFTSVPSSSERSTENNQISSTTVEKSNYVSLSTEEPEEVVLETNTSTFSFITRTMYKKTVEWMGDTYTLSILVPVAAGVLFALTIILTIATCRCIKRKCRRRRFRKRVLPDSIKNLRPSDQARLLGDCDSSDEF